MSYKSPTKDATAIWSEWMSEEGNPTSPQPSTPTAAQGRYYYFTYNGAEIQLKWCRSGQLGSGTSQE